MPIVAKQFGLSAEQTSALGTGLLSVGKTPEIAATGINALLLKLKTAKTQGQEFQHTPNSMRCGVVLINCGLAMTVATREKIRWSKVKQPPLLYPWPVRPVGLGRPFCSCRSCRSCPPGARLYR